MNETVAPQPDTAPQPLADAAPEAAPQVAAVADVPSFLQVPVGNRMLHGAPRQVPVLDVSRQGLPPDAVPGQDAAALSRLAEGMSFVGNALLQGPLSVGGSVQGNLTQAGGADVSVMITETGSVVGDITAQRISVLGYTEGVLDAGQGEVSLQATARVHGRVRYGRIQVNGADLNATLERVMPSNKGA